MARPKTDKDYVIKHLKKEIRDLEKSIKLYKETVELQAKMIHNLQEKKDTEFLHSPQRDIIYKQLEYSQSFCKLVEAQFNRITIEKNKLSDQYNMLLERNNELAAMLELPQETIPEPIDSWSDQLVVTQEKLHTAEGSLVAALEREKLYKSHYETQIADLEELVKENKSSAPMEKNEIEDFLLSLTPEQLTSLLEKSAKKWFEKPQPKRGHKETIPATKKALARKMKAEGMSIRFIAQELEMSVGSVHRAVKAEK